MLVRIASSALTGLHLFYGTWSTFKALKRGEVDVSLLKLWTCLGLLQVVQACLEPVLRFVPFYFLAKCSLLGIFFLMPEVVPIVFDRFVVPGIQCLHDSMNHVVLPRALQFLIDLPFMLFPPLEDWNILTTDTDFCTGPPAIEGSSRKSSLHYYPHLEGPSREHPSSTGLASEGEEMSTPRKQRPSLSGVDQAAQPVSSVRRFLRRTLTGSDTARVRDLLDLEGMPNKDEVETMSVSQGSAAPESPSASLVGESKKPGRKRRISTRKKPAEGPEPEIVAVTSNETQAKLVVSGPKPKRRSSLLRGRGKPLPEDPEELATTTSALRRLRSDQPATRVTRLRPLSSTGAPENITREEEVKVGVVSRLRKNVRGASKSINKVR